MLISCKALSRKGKRRPLRRRLALYAVAFLLVLAAVGVIVLRAEFHGPALGAFVEDTMNDNIRGRVEIDSIEWDLEDLPKAVSGGWVPIRMYGFKLYDDYQLKVLDIPYITGEIDAHAAMFGNHDLIVRNIVIHASDDPDEPRPFALIRMVEEPYPIHEYDEVVVSILSAFYSRKAPSVYAGLTAAPAPVLEFRNFDIRGLELEYELDYFKGVLHEVDGQGFLYADDSDPLSRKLYYSVTARAPTGHLQVLTGDLPAMPLTQVEVHQLEQLPKQWPRHPVANDVEWFAEARSEGGTKLTLSGAMLDYWQDYFGGDYQVRLALTEAGALARLMSDGLASGDNLAAAVDVDGPVLAPRFTVSLRDADIALDLIEGAPKLDLHLSSATAQFDRATEEGYLENTVLQGAGGEVQLQSTFALHEPMQVDLNIAIPKAIEMRPYLPAHVANLAGTKLRGRLHAFGTKEAQRIDDLHLWLGRAHLQGVLYREKGSIIHADDLRISMGDSMVTARKGWLDFASGMFDLPLAFTSGDPGRYLRYFGAPPLADRLAGNGRVRGSFDDPRATGTVVARGVPIVDKVEASLDFRDQLLSVNQLRSDQLGGSLTGRARIRFGDEVTVLGATADARKLDLSRAPVVGDLVSGLLSGQLEARGPVDRLTASARADVEGMELFGDPYMAFALALEQGRDGDQTAELTATRQYGGDVIASVNRDRSGDLGGAVSVRKVPIETLAFLADRPEQSPVGGLLEADFNLGGTDRAPTIDGTVSLVRSWFGAAFLGAADLEIKRLGPGKLGMSAHMFQGKLILDGTLETAPPYRAELTVRARRVEIDQFVPALVTEYQVRGWFSGEISVTAELAGRSKPSAVLNLTELTLLRDNVDPQGRPAPIRLRNKTPLVILYDGTSAQLQHVAVFESPGGDFAVSGGGTMEALALQLQGQVAVKLLQPYLRDYFADMGGLLTIAIDITGTAASPQLTGTVEFENVLVRPLGQDATVTVPRGKVTVTPTQVAITDFTVRMVDRESDERAELTIRGGIGMDDFTPTVWALQAEGQLAGKMLLVAAPRTFSSATGMAYVNIWLRGPGESPDDIDGTLWFACPRADATDELEQEDFALVGKRCQIDRPLTFNARGFRQELSFDQGRVRVDEYDDEPGTLVVEVRGLEGWIENEGRMRRIEGELTLVDGRPREFDLRGAVSALPLRIPRTLDLTVNVEEFQVAGGFGAGDGLDIIAEVEIIDGRYVRNFNLVSGFLPSERTTEVSKPFYEQIPLLANANLSIGIQTRAFFVENNVANIQLSGDLDITGTPSDPRFSGNINVDQGRFKFQGMRAQFTRTNGDVSFSKNQSFPDDTPVLNITSEADFQDSSGQDHLITLIIRGTLSNFEYDLFTDTGLNKGQTLTLISSGRRAEDVRQSLGDEAIGNDPTKIQNTQSGSIYDELVKDLAGDFISLLIEDKLRDITKLDVARLEIGTSSVGFHAEKELFKNLRMLGDLEKTLRGWEWTMRGELRVSDRFSIEGEYLQRNQEDDAEEDTSEGRLRAVWRKGWQ